jgi:hypothetical protein
MAIAKLTIEVEAALAKFETDMRRIAATAESAFARVGRAGVSTGAVFKGSLLATELDNAVRGLVRLVPNLVEGVARFQDLEEQTGASAEALAAMQTPADVAGVSIDQLAGFMVKLTGTLSKTNDETKGAGLALNKLGLDLSSFRSLAPEEQFRVLAERIEALPQGANRTAIAIALLGKSGAEALPFLKELATTGLAQNRISAEQIRLADDLADRNAKLRSELRQAAQVAAIQLLPALNALLEELAKVARGFNTVDDAAGQLSGGGNVVRSFAEGAAEGLAVLADAALFAGRAVNTVVAGVRSAEANRNVGLAATNPEAVAEFVRSGTGPLKDALDKRNAAVAEANKQLTNLLKADDFAISTNLRNRFAAEALGRSAGLDDIDKLFKPRRNTAGGGAASLAGPDDKAAREAEQLRKARAEEALRALQRAFGTEQDAIKFQQRFLEAQYAQGLVSLEEFYDRRAELNQRGLETQLRGFQAEADSLRESLKAPDVGEAERVRINGRIAEVEARAADARAQYASDEQVAALETAKAYTDASDRVIQFRAEVLELQGDLARAAELRAGLAIAQAQRSATATGLTQDDISRFEQAVRASNELANAQRRAGEITERFAIAEERFIIAAREGGATREQIEQGVTAIRREQLALLGEQVRKAEELAAAQGPDSPAAQGAARLRLEYERAAASVDQLKLRLEDFATNVGDSTARTITDAIIDGDWKAAGKRIGEDINRAILEEEITKPLAEQLRNFLRTGISGSGGPIEQLGNSVARLFGFQGSSGNAPTGSPSSLVATPGVFDGTVGGFFNGVFGGGAQGRAAPLGSTPGTLPTASNSAAVELNLLAAAARNASGALGAPVQGTAGPSLGGIFRVFDPSGIGIGSTQPSVQRDELRRIEAGGSAETAAAASQLQTALGGATDAVYQCGQEFINAQLGIGNLGNASSVAGLALQALPQILQALAGSSGAGGAIGSLFSSITGGAGSSGGLDFIGNTFIKLFGFAGGGPIQGPGTATSDSIPIWASDGEFMVRNKAAQQPGAPEFLERFNAVGMQALEEALQRRGYAAGGEIRRVPVVVSPRAGYAGGGMVWRGPSDRGSVQTSVREGDRSTVFDMRGANFGGGRYEDRMAEQRRVQKQMTEVQRRVARHLA